ncbi:MAG: hypothetical protein AAFN92_00550 [Bacteroidota bacterium]
MKNLSILFKTSAVLWAIWGIVHVFAGVMTVYFVTTQDISGAVSGIADGIDPVTVQMDYPAAAGAIIGQHGFNLLWVGLVTFLCAFYVWKGNKNAIFLAAITGGLTDLGYFIFIDLGGFNNFVPGTVMTIISAAAIALSFYAYSQREKT